MKRILGIDYGEKRVGLAISDGEGRIALVLQTVHHHDMRTAAAQVAEVVHQENILTAYLFLLKRTIKKSIVYCFRIFQ